MKDLTPWLSLAERLPPLVEQQFAAYRRLAYADTGPEDGPRELVAWENARKAALGHLQALIRVYDLVHGHLGQNSPAAAAEPDLARMLSDVRSELSAEDDADEGFAV